MNSITVFQNILIPFISALVGALSSALLFHKLAMKRENSQQRFKRTHQMIDQFYSKEFINHRIAISQMRKKVLNSEIGIRFISHGYLYASNQKSYAGETINGLTEHQHLTIYFGYIERLGLYILNDQVDKNEIKAALSYKLIWSADLVRAIADDVKKLANSLSSPIPPFVSKVELVLNSLDLDIQNDKIGASHAFSKKEVKLEDKKTETLDKLVLPSQKL